MKKLYREVDLFTYTLPDGKTAFVAGDPWDESRSRGAVYFESWCGSDEPAWVLSCEEVAEDEGVAAVWVAAVPR
jgi:hypothetical protein